MGSDEGQIFKMYDEIGLGRNEVCQGCIQAHQKMRTPLSTPVSIWRVGEAFADDPRKIMFVGKPARTFRRLDGQDFEDARENGEHMFFHLHWPFWSYTREIVRRLYGSAEEGWRRIAFTNVIKCGNSEKEDRTTEEMKVNCIDRLGVIWREIEVLTPRSIIFYTHHLCDDQIDRFRYADEWQEICNKSHRVPNGEKELLWWHREFRQNGVPVLRLLRTSHPERQLKEGFVGRVVEWLKASPGIDTSLRS